MQAAARKPRTNHLDLAQSILDVARQRGFKQGARLPEQQIASLCKVSRTPVRAALRLLADRGLVERDPEAGYRLAADLSSQQAALPDLPTAEEDDLAEDILRDRSARRLDETVTVSGLARRYDLSRGAVLKALKRLADESFIERGPGQSWLFRPAPDAPDALAESYDFRLVLEPAAILAPGFQLDGDKASALRDAMEALLALPDASFDIREFQRLDPAARNHPGRKRFPAAPVDAGARRNHRATGGPAVRDRRGSHARPSPAFQKPAAAGGEPWRAGPVRQDPPAGAVTKP